MQNSQAALKTSIATVSIAGDFWEKLTAISRTGYTVIAFSCQDILITAQKLSELGFDRLPISANSYDEVGARFGLMSHFLDG